MFRWILTERIFSSFFFPLLFRVSNKTIFTVSCASNQIDLDLTIQIYNLEYFIDNFKFMLMYLNELFEKYINLMKWIEIVKE